MTLLKEHEGAIHLRNAGSADLPGIFTLLSQAQLPLPLQNESVEFLVAEQAGERLAGCIGWEIHGQSALLRSLVVEECSRNRGIAAALVKFAMDELCKRRITDFVLLTIQAVNLAVKLGFEPVDRDALPPEIRRCPQLSSGGCSSALCMRRCGRITAPP